MQVIYAQQPVPDDHPSLFLAGPTPRSKSVASWRPGALQILKELSFSGLVFVPEFSFDEQRVSPKPFDGEAQIYWEWQALDQSDAIAFWVPRDLKTLPGFTTNIEFGLYCQSGKALLGAPPGAAKIRYLELLARKNNIPVHHDLRELLQDAINKAESKHDDKTTR